jgi:HK97 family phage portal protein
MGLNEVASLIKRGNSGQFNEGRPGNTYSSVGVVFSCVKAKADALAMLPLMLSADDDQVIESGPLVDLAECPRPGLTGRAFWKETASLLDLFGRVHWVFELDTGGRPVMVQPVNPLQMRPIIDRGTGGLTGWKFRPVGVHRGREITIPLDQVHTIIDPDFEDPTALYCGLSPRIAVTTAIAQYYKADLANESSLNNGCDPGLVLDYGPNSNLTDEQINEVYRQFRESRRGPDKRNSIIVMGGGATVSSFLKNFKDMEFSELKKMTRADICAAFNVPPAVIGYYEDSNYAHAQAAQEQFWINTILPLAERLAEEWDIGVVRRFEGDRSLAMADARRSATPTLAKICRGYKTAKRAAVRSGRKLFSWFDPAGVPAVQAAQLSQVTQAKEWNAMGVPLNDILRATDAPFPEQPHGNTWYKPIGLMDVREDATPGGSDPSGAEPDAALLPDAQEGIAQRATEAEKAALWRLWRASWAGLERKAEGKLTRHFFGVRSEVLKNIKAKLTDPGSSRSVKRSIIGELLFDIVKADSGLVAKLGPVLREGFRLGGEQSMLEAAQAQGKDAKDADPFNLKDPRSVELLQRRKIKLTDINRTLRRQLAESLGQGVDAGESVAQLSERVKKITGYAHTRAATIARTEVGASVEEARHEGRRQAGVPMKSWLWSRKETGRQIHAATERATLDNPVPNDEDFTLAGTSITCPHPRATGQPEHDINCGCTTIARYAGDSIKAAMNRYRHNGFLTYERLAQRDKGTAA